MSRRAAFASMQARLQSRHGDRADEAEWRRLDSAGELAGYLQMARRSPLRNWVLGLHDSFDIHETERTLKQHYRHYVHEIAGWMPTAEWKTALIFCDQLVDLPVVSHLLAGQPMPLWLADDSRLGSFGEASFGERRDTLRDSEFAWTLQAEESDLATLWYRHWQTLWSSPEAYHRGLRQIASAVDQYRRAVPAEKQLPALEQQLTAQFRQLAFQPGAAVAHLALVSIDLAKLRGALAIRTLFPAITGGAS